MFDTINFKITRREVEGVDFLSEISTYLNPESICIHNFQGTEVVTGRTGNLEVSISQNQVRVRKGSLCKWHLGDNYQSLGRADTQRAVERLSDVLHLPMNRAIITRLDVGLTIPVRHPTDCYFSHLGELRYAKRLPQTNGLYYHRHRQSERLCFYDKNREQREHREPIPDLYKDCHVLRYEQRYMARLPELLNVSQVTGALLYDEEFYIGLLNRWRDTYREITKTNELTLNFQVMGSVKQFQRMGVLCLVEKMGGELEMLNQIKEAQKRGELDSKKAFDLRKMIKKAFGSDGEMVKPSEEIAELDKKITEAIRFYR